MENEDANSVKKVWNRQMVKIVAILVLAVGIGLGFFVYRTNYAVASTIWLNGASGIEIKVNQNEKVLEVNVTDAVAQAIIGKTDFRGSNLDVTINALFGSLMRNGYFRDGTDSVMIRVESKDSVKEQKLQNELTEDVNELLQNDLFRDSAANRTGLTEGELEQESGWLNSMESGSGENRETNGGEAYIEEEEAKSIVLSHAAVPENAVTQYYAKLDYENGIRVYEIEFYADGYEYDYEINALTGEIISQKKEQDKNQLLMQTNSSGNAGGTGSAGDGNITASSGNTGSSYIGESKAREIALTRAGLNGGSGSVIEVELDREDGIMVYEVEIKSGGYEYQCEINAVTGEIISYEKEWDD